MGGRLKMLLFIESLMSRKEFVDFAMLSNNYDMKPLEYAIYISQLSVVKHLIDIKEIQDQYKDNDPLIFRLFFVLFVKNSNHYLTEYVLSALQISKEKVIQMMSYKCPRQPKADNKGAFEFHRMNILCRAVWTGTFDRLKRLMDLIGDQAFVDNMLNTDALGWTPIGYAVMGKKINVIKYIFSLNAVKEKYLSDNRALYGLVATINQFIGYKETVKCVVDGLGLTEAKLKEFKSVYANTNINLIIPFTK